MPVLEGFHHSQLSLRTYRECPLRFRRRYVDRLWWSRDWGEDQEQQRAIRVGQEFHLLASRYFWGIPSGSPGDGELTEWLGALERFLPRQSEFRYLPEQELRTGAGELPLLAKYDLLVWHPDGRAVIYDWKTSPRAPSARRLERDLQTSLYRFLLCRAGEFLRPGGFHPEAVTMVYWNPRFPEEPVKLPYTSDAYRGDAAELAALVAEISALPPEGFSASGDAETCRRCEYRPLCRGEALEEEGDAEAQNGEGLELSWEAVPELP